MKTTFALKFITILLIILNTQTTLGMEQQNDTTPQYKRHLQNTDAIRQNSQEFYDAAIKKTVETVNGRKPGKTGVMPIQVESQEKFKTGLFTPEETRRRQIRYVEIADEIEQAIQGCNIIVDDLNNKKIPTVKTSWDPEDAYKEDKQQTLRSTRALRKQSKEGLKGWNELRDKDEVFRKKNSIGFIVDEKDVKKIVEQESTVTKALSSISSSIIKIQQPVFDGLSGTPRPIIEQKEIVISDNTSTAPVKTRTTTKNDMIAILEELQRASKKNVKMTLDDITKIVLEKIAARGLFFPKSSILGRVSQDTIYDADWQNSMSLPQDLVMDVPRLYNPNPIPNDITPEGTWENAKPYDKIDKNGEMRQRLIYTPQNYSNNPALSPILCLVIHGRSAENDLSYFTDQTYFNQNFRHIQKNIAWYAYKKKNKVEAHSFKWNTGVVGIFDKEIKRGGKSLLLFCNYQGAHKF